MTGPYAVDIAYEDDPTIPDNADLWRRIHPNQTTYDDNQGRIRPSSAAFTDSSNGSPMSVVIAAECDGPTRVLAGYERYGLASFKARVARESGLGIVRDPLPDQPAHAFVFGPKSKKVQSKLAKATEWVVLPPDPV
jgi:hypothetical protein